MRVFCRVLVVVAAAAVSCSALASVGAAIDKKTGRINYLQGNAPRVQLVKLALEACREHVAKPAQCASVTNNIGACEQTKLTGYTYGVFAAHYEVDGWHGYMACAKTNAEARDYVSAMCDHCAMGEQFYDESDSE